MGAERRSDDGVRGHRWSGKECARLAVASRARSRRHATGEGRVLVQLYEGGADMASFAAHALAYVTVKPLKRFGGRKTADLMRELIPALASKPFLLLLDGLERILVAYHRPDAAQLRDEEVRADGDHRDCIRSIDEDLLRELVGVAPSRVLITSRLMPNALTNRTGRSLPGVRHRFLGGMTSDDALTVLRDAGVRGSESVMRRYFEENFENHALLIGIVAGLVNDYVHAPEDFDRWVDDPQGGAALRLSKLELTERRSHILAAALRGLAPDVRKLLSRIAALSDSVPFETVAALSPFRPIEPARPEEFDPWWLQECEQRLKNPVVEDRSVIEAEIREQQSLQQRLENDRGVYNDAMRFYLQSVDYHEAVPRLVAALQELQRRGLLQWDRTTNRYDMHPVTRGYSFDVLDNVERVDISNRIADHFQQRPADRYVEAKSLSDVQQSIELMRALIRAERWDEATTFWFGEFGDTMLFNLAAYRESEVLLRQINGTAPESPEHFDYDSARCLTDLSICSIGRNVEAEKFEKRLTRFYLGQERGASLGRSLQNLAVTYESQGRLALSIRTMVLAVRVFELCDEEGLTVSQSRLMDRAIAVGDFRTAESAYEVFRTMTPPTNRSNYRSGDIETSLCWLRFYQDALTSELLEEAREKSQGVRYLIKSLSLLSGEQHLKGKAYNEAIAAFEEALRMAYDGSTPATEMEARLALARALSGDRDRALATVERLGALPMDVRPSVTLAEYHLAMGEPHRALAFANDGYKRSWCDGPPYASWWSLERARAVLRALNTPEPILPAFDSDKVEHVPWEDEIEALIRKWSKESQN